MFNSLDSTLQRFVTDQMLKPAVALCPEEQAAYNIPGCAAAFNITRLNSANSVRLPVRSRFLNGNYQIQIKCHAETTQPKKAKRQFNIWDTISFTNDNDDQDFGSFPCAPATVTGYCF